MSRFFFSRFIPAFLAVICVVPLAGFARAEDGAAKFVQEYGNKAVSVITDSAMSDGEKEQALSGLIEEIVDFERLTRLVLGKYARRISEEEASRFANLYHDYMLLTYVPRFKSYSGESIVVTSSHEVKDNFFLVKTQFERPQKEPVLVDFRLYKNEEGQYSVLDIVGEGVSLVNTQRSEFGSVIERKGMDYLLGALEKKIARLQSATPTQRDEMLEEKVSEAPQEESQEAAQMELENEAQTAGGPASE